MIFGGTRLGREIRAIGGDRRASRVAGVRVDRTLVGLFTVSGTLAALGGALTATATHRQPQPGIPAADPRRRRLPRRRSFAGRRPRPARGLLAGALSVALLGQIDAITAIPDYYTELLYAALLGIIVAIDAPGLRRGHRPAQGAHPHKARRPRY